MKKALLLFAAGLLAGNTTLQAQQQSRSQLPAWAANQRFNAGKQRVLSLIPKTAVQKTTGTSQRLTARSNYYESGFGLQPGDSILYKYSGMRTSKFSLMDLAYNTEYAFDPFQQEDYVNFDTAYRMGVLVHIISDTNYRSRNASGEITLDTRSENQIQQFIYDAQGHVSQVNVQMMDPITNQFRNYRKYRYQFNAQGRLNSDTSFVWSGTSTWLPNEINTYTYGSNNLPKSATTYVTNGSGFEPSYRMNLSYTAGNQISVIGYDGWNGTAFEASDKDTFAYAGNAMIYHAIIVDYFGSIFTAYEERRHLNSASQPDSVTMSILQDPMTMTYDTVINRLTWNSSGNPVTKSSRPSTSPTPDELNNFYYTSFQTTQGVASAPVRKSLRIFPNPADNQISIQPDFSGRYSCSITNAAGQLMLSSTGTATSGEPLSLPLSNLAPGRYWLQLQNGEGAQYSASFLRK